MIFYDLLRRESYFGYILLSRAYDFTFINLYEFENFII